MTRMVSDAPMICATDDNLTMRTRATLAESLEAIELALQSLMLFAPIVGAGIPL